MLQVNNLSYSSGGKTLLNKLSFKVAEGFTFILGGNGAGKSLLLRQLHGLDQPKAGTVVWDTLNHQFDRRYIFQKPILLNRTVRQNLTYVAKRIGIDEDAVTSHMAKVGLLEFADQNALLLSGGEQQKLVFARETLGVPKVLLLDEPTANLAPNTILDIEQLVLEEHGNGTSVLMTSHDVPQIKRFAHKVEAKVLFLNEGSLVYTGTAQDFFSAVHKDQPEIQLFLGL